MKTNETKIRYKPNHEDQIKFENITSGMEKYLYESLDKLKELFQIGNKGGIEQTDPSNNLENSIWKPLPVPSKSINEMSICLVKIDFPTLSQEIVQVLNTLEPIQPSSLNLKNHGPFKYPDGSIYYGNYSNA